MEQVELTTLRNEVVTLKAVQSSVCFESGGSFKIEVHVANVSGRTIGWVAGGEALNIAYRWFDATGNCIDPDGRRTPLQSPLREQFSADVIVAGQVPAEPGRYELIISLLLENVHWACDVSDEGWTRTSVLVERPAAWPSELRSSPSGKALRGSLAAAEIVESLKLQPFDVAGAQPLVVKDVRPSTELASTPPTRQIAAAPKRMHFFVRFRAWFRHFFGLPEMRSAIEELLRQSSAQQAQLDALLDHARETSSRFDGLDRNLKKFLQQSTSQQGALSLLAEEGAVLAEQLSHLAAFLKPMRAEVARGRRDIKLQHDSISKQLDSVSETLSSDLLAGFSDLSTAANAIERTLQEITPRISRETSDIVESRMTAGHTFIEDVANQLRVEIQKSSQDLVSAFSGGQVIDELISSIRQSLTLLVSVHDVISLRDPALSEASAGALRSLESLNERQVEKLDLLLTREVIPVSAANLVLIRNPLGLLAVQDDDAAAIAFYSDGRLPEFGSVAVVEKLLKPGELFIDVGANVGAYTLLAARRVGSSGTVISIEPVPRTASMLRTTAAINGISAQVEIHECALGEHDGHSSISVGPTSGHSSFRPLHGGADMERVGVPIRRGADLIGDRIAAMVKIDVEGFELEVLRGLQSLLTKCDAALIVEYSPEHIGAAGLTTKEWLKQVRHYRPQVWIIEDSPIALRLLPARSAPPKSASNLLCCNALPDELRPLVAAGV